MLFSTIVNCPVAAARMIPSGVVLRSVAPLAPLASQFSAEDARFQVAEASFQGRNASNSVYGWSALSVTVSVIVAAWTIALVGIAEVRSHCTSASSVLPLPLGVSPLTDSFLSPPWFADGLSSSSIVSRVPE